MSTGNSNDIISVYTTFVNHSLRLISEKKFDSLTLDDKNTIIGSLAILTGWINPIRTGSQVLASINGKETICEVIDGGFNSGKTLTSIVICGD